MEIRTRQINFPFEPLAPFVYSSLVSTVLFLRHPFVATSAVRQRTTVERTTVACFRLQSPIAGLADANLARASGVETGSQAATPPASELSLGPTPLARRNSLPQSERAAFPRPCAGPQSHGPRVPGGCGASVGATRTRVAATVAPGSQGLKKYPGVRISSLLLQGLIQLHKEILRVAHARTGVQRDHGRHRNLHRSAQALRLGAIQLQIQFSVGRG